MKHSLIEAASQEQLDAAAEAADWMLDAIATATQDRRFLRGEPEYDQIMSETILANGKIAALRAMKNLEVRGAEAAELRACLESTRDEICEGPVDDVLWHTSVPACTTVDNITLVLGDGWTYDGWLQAKEDQL